MGVFKKFLSLIKVNVLKLLFNSSENNEEKVLISSIKKDLKTKR